MRVFVCLLLALALCPGLAGAQKSYRYVVEVVSTPSKAGDKAVERSGASRQVSHRPSKKVTRYYEIISKTPLTLRQCDSLIKRGKARQVFYKRKPRAEDMDLWSRKNMTVDGEEGINPWDVEPTEYDLKHEDPDLYDFIAD